MDRPTTASQRARARKNGAVAGCRSRSIEALPLAALLVTPNDDYCRSSSIFLKLCPCSTVAGAPFKAYWAPCGKLSAPTRPRSLLPEASAHLLSLLWP
uniref:Uncharacterized protein n=1 Tax=Panagrellus redivivus TaxID=6233 RepID=A0A7E4ZYM5_PANRE